jgi:vacuolar protein-sorting-associated protein 4
MDGGRGMLDQAIPLISQAKVADEKGCDAEALELYRKGLQYLHLAYKYSSHPIMAETIRAKLTTYLQRAEDLKVRLDQQAASAASSGSATASAVPDGRQGRAPDDRKSEDAEMEESLKQSMQTQRPDIRWSDVAGLENTKLLLEEAITMPSSFPNLFTGTRTAWTGVLLYGPPGTGKSMIAKAAANETGVKCFLSISSSDIMSKWQGNSEKKIRSLFRLARKNSPSVIFIDEIDSICRSRSDEESESSRRVKTELLVQMDGFGSINQGIMVLAATNTPWDLDEALLRRLEKRVYISLPEESARYTILKNLLTKVPHAFEDDDLLVLAYDTKDFSGADMATLAKHALYQPIGELSRATRFFETPHGWAMVPADKPGTETDATSEGDGEWDGMGSVVNITLRQLKDRGANVVPPPVTSAHLTEALLNSRKSVSTEGLGRYEKWTKDFGTGG